MRSFKVVIQLTISFSLVLAASPAFAEVPGVVNNASPVIVKLGRGLANTLGGVLEIPLMMQQVTIERGPVAGLTLGTLLGTERAVARILVGVVETLTFPFPLTNGYEPLYYPEFVLEPSASTSNQPAQAQPVPAAPRL